MQCPRARRFCSGPLALLVLAGSSALLHRPLLAQPAGGGMAANPAPAGLAEEGAAWGALNALRDKMKGADAEATIKAYNDFYAAHGELHPVVANVLTTDVAALYRDQLKQPDKALEIYNWGLDKFKTQDASILMLEGKGRTLLDTGHAEEASKLMEERWPQVILMARGEHPHLRLTASRCIQIRVQALQKQGKADEATALLKSTLQEAPDLLDPALQTSADWSQGWMYAALVDALIEAKHLDEAASWARLAFEESAFDKGAIDRASELMGRVWAAREDFVSARAFGAAQTDLAHANPMSKIALPTLSPALLGSELKRLQEAQAKSYDQNRAPQIVTLLIAMGQTRPAMEEARRLLVKAPTAPQGVQQVARVFKAGDLSLARANQFVAYLDGKAENSLPAFMQADAPEAPKAEAPPKVATAPKNTP